MENDRRKLKDRRVGPDRRSFSYTKYVPERRSGNGRRILDGNRRKKAGGREGEHNDG